MELPKDLKHLFLIWIQTEYSVKLQMQSKMSHTYGNAMKSLKNCPLQIQHPKQLIDVKHFGPKLVQAMEGKLKEYCNEHGYPYPDPTEEMKEKERAAREKDERLKEKNKAKTNNNANSITKTKTKTKKANTTDNANASDGHGDDDDDNDDNTPARKRKKKYVPAAHSGGYAILIVLLKHDSLGKGLTKTQITQHAVNYCHSSFQANASAGNFYSAFSSMKTLLNNDYVVKEGRPEYYSLTEEGRQVAKVLKEMDDVARGVATVSSNGRPNSTPEKSQRKTKTGKENRDAANRSFTEPGMKTPRSNNPLSTSSPVVSDVNGRRQTPRKMPGVISRAINGANSSFTDNANNSSIISSSPLRSAGVNLEAVRNGKSEYQVWKAGTYEIIFVLDNREVYAKNDRDSFGNTLKDKGVRVEVRPLAVGDGLWIAKNRKTGDESTLNFIFERKRLDDLAGSIKDGRFREQKTRLEKTGMTHIYYIVEEQMGSDVSSMAEALVTSMAMATTYSGFHMKRTNSFDETIEFITGLNFLIKRRYSNKTLLVLEPRGENYDLLEMLKMHRAENPDREVVFSYSTFAEKLNKSSQLTVRDMYIRLLLVVQGIGLDKAVAIADTFPTPQSLFAAFERAHNITPDGTDCHAVLSWALRDEVGARKVGPALSKRIASNFCSRCARCDR